MSRNRNRSRLLFAVVAAVAAALALVVSACGGGGGGGASSSTTATTIGKGEGSLNVIEWPYYTDKSFAQPFEQKTGCIIHRKDAGTSNQMFALMHNNGGGGGGQYDLVSASGDASLRLIDAGDVTADRHQPDPELEGLPAAVQVAAAQHGRRQALRRLGAVGTEHPDLQHAEGEPGADGLGCDL